MKTMSTDEMIVEMVKIVKNHPQYDSKALAIKLESIKKQHAELVSIRYKWLRTSKELDKLDTGIPDLYKSLHLKI